MQERQWMSQKDQLLRELDSVKEQLNIDQPDQKKKVVLNVSNNAGDSTRRHKQELKVKVIIMFLCLRSFLLRFFDAYHC